LSYRRIFCGQGSQVLYPIELRVQNLHIVTIWTKKINLFENKKTVAPNLTWNPVFYSGFKIKFRTTICLIHQFRILHVKLSVLFGN